MLLLCKYEIWGFSRKTCQHLTLMTVLGSFNSLEDTDIPILNIYSWPCAYSLLYVYRQRIFVDKHDSIWPWCRQDSNCSWHPTQLVTFPCTKKVQRFLTYSIRDERAAVLIILAETYRLMLLLLEYNLNTTMMYVGSWFRLSPWVAWCLFFILFIRMNAYIKHCNKSYRLDRQQLELVAGLEPRLKSMTGLPTEPSQPPLSCDSFKLLNDKSMVHLTSLW